MKQASSRFFEKKPVRRCGRKTLSVIWAPCVPESAVMPAHASIHVLLDYFRA
jgi:hypothetical protein